MRRALLIPFLATVAIAAYCDERPSMPVVDFAAACADPGNVCTNGAVHFVQLEGGFWVVEGDNGKPYDPMGGMPSGFTTEGLRVKLVAKPRTDVASFHMYGTIVEIVSITKLP